MECQKERKVSVARTSGRNDRQEREERALARIRANALDPAEIQRMKTMTVEWERQTRHERLTIQLEQRHQRETEARNRRMEQCSRRVAELKEQSQRQKESATKTSWQQSTRQRQREARTMGKDSLRQNTGRRTRAYATRIKTVDKSRRFEKERQLQKERTRKQKKQKVQWIKQKILERRKSHANRNPISRSKSKLKKAEMKNMIQREMDNKITLDIYDEILKKMNGLHLVDIVKEKQLQTATPDKPMVKLTQPAADLKKKKLLNMDQREIDKKITDALCDEILEKMNTLHLRDTTALLTSAIEKKKNVKTASTGDEPPGFFRKIRNIFGKNKPESTARGKPSAKNETTVHKQIINAGQPIEEHVEFPRPSPPTSLQNSESDGTPNLTQESDDAVFNYVDSPSPVKERVSESSSTAQQFSVEVVPDAVLATQLDKPVSEAQRKYVEKYAKKEKERPKEQFGAFTSSVARRKKVTVKKSPIIPPTPITKRGYSQSSTEAGSTQDSTGSWIRDLPVEKGSSLEKLKRRFPDHRIGRGGEEFQPPSKKFDARRSGRIPPVIDVEPRGNEFPEGSNASRELPLSSIYAESQAVLFGDDPQNQFFFPHDDYEQQFLPQEDEPELSDSSLAEITPRDDEPELSDSSLTEISPQEDEPELSDSSLTEISPQEDEPELSDSSLVELDPISYSDYGDLEQPIQTTREISPNLSLELSEDERQREQWDNLNSSSLEEDDRSCEEAIQEEGREEERETDDWLARHNLTVEEYMSAFDDAVEEDEEEQEEERCEAILVKSRKGVNPAAIGRISEEYCYRFLFARSNKNKTISFHCVTCKGLGHICTAVVGSDGFFQEHPSTLPHDPLCEPVLFHKELVARRFYETVQTIKSAEKPEKASVAYLKTVAATTTDANYSVEDRIGFGDALTSYKHKKSSLNRARQANPAWKSCMKFLEERFKYSLLTTSRTTKPLFVQYHDDTLLICYTEEMFSQKNKGKTPWVALMADGIHSVRPRELGDNGQLYTVHGVTQRGSAAPLLHAFTNCKNTVAYERLFKIVKEQLEKGGTQVANLPIVTDFERSAMKAAEQVFGKLNVYGCSFHFAMAFNRKAKKLESLCEKYPIIQTWIDRLRALTFFPDNQALIEMTEILSLPVSTKHAGYEQCKDFLHYFQNTWLQGPYKGKWQKFLQDDNRTSNIAESFNKAAKSALGYYPQLGETIEYLRNYQTSKYFALRRDNPEIDEKFLARREEISQHMRDFFEQIKNNAVNKEVALDYLDTMAQYPTRKTI